MRPTCDAQGSGCARRFAPQAATPSSRTGRGTRSRSGSYALLRGADSAPTVLCYGHFDVQPPDPLELWETPPFEATVRDGQVFGRGVADDKGQLFLLLEAAARLSRAGELPVNVRFACDGEEETGGHSIVDYLAADERGADACVIFDSAMVARDVPAFNIATRGLCYLHLTLRTGERDLHSGIYGGAALNAVSTLARVLQAVLPGDDGRLPEPLRQGLVPPSEEERGGLGLLAGGRPRARESRRAGRWTRRRPTSSTRGRGPSRRST